MRANGGANHLRCLRERMAQAPTAVVEDPFAFVWNDCVKEYFIRMHHDFTAYGDEAGWQAYSEYLHHGLFAIRRRLEVATLCRTDGHAGWGAGRQYPAAAPTAICMAGSAT